MKEVKCILSFLMCILFSCFLFAQDVPQLSDTFFLAKKKGLMGKLGKAISIDGVEPIDVVVVNPYLIYQGKIIKKIRVMRLGFERDINDTTKYNNKFGVIVARAVHHNTKQAIILNNLFFSEGDKLNPYLLSDNERHLREQSFLQDARIIVEKMANDNEVSILIMVKDVFSIGADVDVSSVKNIRVQVKEENVGGSGSRLAIGTLYDYDRNPNFGWGAEFLKRNIRGSFINWNTGFRTYNGAFNSGRNEELTFFTSFEKPLVSPYTPWIGAADVSFNKTNNNYINDTAYQKDFRYSNFRADGWFGYNFGTLKMLTKNQQSRIRKFIAVRGLYQQFQKIPERFNSVFDYRYSNISGVLTAITVFKQNFYRANFIYGFGRNEDIPQGFSASIIGGITNKQDSTSNALRKRAYYGTEVLSSHLNKKGFYSTYTLKMGMYTKASKVEDFDILLNVDHFTSLKKISSHWLNRNFFSAGFARQFSPVLEPALQLNSNYGLPYFNNGDIKADMRITAKAETVFFNVKKFLGFRFAPFVFTDAALIKQMGNSFSKSDVFGAIGAGVRTRNENLVLGTIELKGFYFPKTIGDMPNWSVQINTNIRFKYSSYFIKKPDFIIPN